MEKISIRLEGLGCANCAAKIEERSSKIEGLSNVVVDVSRSKLVAFTEAKDKTPLVTQVKDIVMSLEPHVKVTLEDPDAHLGHTHSNDSGRTHDKPTLLRLGGALLLLILGIVLEDKSAFAPALLLVSYAIAGYKVLWKSLSNIRRGQVFDENFLMSIATIGAIAIGEYPEAVAVMVFYEIGEYFQGLAVARSKKAIGGLMDIRPDAANVNRGGFWMTVSPGDVAVDELIMVKPGERVPLDGIVVEGTALVDTAALTGESLPQAIKPDQKILSGSVVQDGVLKIKVTSEFSQSTVARILDLVENATANKAQAEYFITKFARYYTPVVVFAAIGLALIPPFLLNMGPFSDWLYRGLVFLVISCPCALVVSVPLTFFSGIGNASKNGILIKGSNYLEALGGIDTVVFDKTGTLTEGVFEVSRLHLSKAGKAHGRVEKLAALAEMHSNHPIAKSIVANYDGTLDESEILNYEEVSGHGIRLTTADGVAVVGNRKWMRENKIDVEAIDSVHTLIFLAQNDVFLGAFEIRDKVKEDAKAAIEGLNQKGLHTMMLTGDRKPAAQAVAQELGLESFESELLPEDKYNIVSGLIKDEKKVAFIGDGINDAPVLAGATVGISMGTIGSDAAIEASDVVLMTDEPHKLLKAIDISKRTVKIVMQNIVMALGIKFVIMALGVVGISSMWMAIFADVGVTLIAVLNAMRALRS